MSIILFIFHTKSGGSDYEGASFTVTFPAGVNVISFNVTIINGIIAECAELFTLDLEIPEASADMGVQKGSPDTATVNIMDDDGEDTHCTMPLSMKCESELPSTNLVYASFCPCS